MAVALNSFSLGQRHYKECRNTVNAQRVINWGVLKVKLRFHIFLIKSPGYSTLGLKLKQHDLI
jgi:hypothetical protein